MIRRALVVHFLLIDIPPSPDLSVNSCPSLLLFGAPHGAGKEEEEARSTGVYVLFSSLVYKCQKRQIV